MPSAFRTTEDTCQYWRRRRERERETIEGGVKQLITFLMSCSQSDFIEFENIFTISLSAVNDFPLPLMPLVEREREREREREGGGRGEERERESKEMGEKG